MEARKLQEAVDSLLEEKRLMKEMELCSDESYLDGYDSGWNDEEKSNKLDLDYEFLSYELEYLALYGFRPTSSSWSNRESYDNHDDGISSFHFMNNHYSKEHERHVTHHVSQLRNHQSSSLMSNFNNKSVRKNDVASGIYSSSSNNDGSIRSSYTPLLHLPLHLLTEQEVIHTLRIPGGKKEVIQILLDGAHAREVLMRKNVKLVTSIAKQWMKNSFSTRNANLGSEGGGGGGSGGNGSSGSNKFLSQMYQGSWDRPSLDEAIQEGMLGLARAVDKYDPERGLRFSTYATHWITSYVRVCFQRAVTGCLRVPSQLHDIKVGCVDY